MTGVKQTRAVLERFGERATSLADWSAKFAQVSVPAAVAWGLRFIFYWRYSDADRQDPATSRGWQAPRAQAAIAGRGLIAREVCDAGVPREVHPTQRPGLGALLEQAADPNRDFDAIVIGSYERAFCGNQFSYVAPLLLHHGVGLWMPEVGGEVDAKVSTVEDLMDLLGTLSRREIALKRARSLGAMQYAVQELGRFMGGRPNYGYRFVDVAIHPNRRLACRGITLQQLALHTEISQVVVWIFQARLEGHSYKRIARALNETSIPCSSAADPVRNAHRSKLAWTEGTVREILLNPVYTGRKVWGRERAERVLLDPDNPSPGYRTRRVHTSPDQWTFSRNLTHPALVSEKDFLAVQGMRATRTAVAHTYLLAGMLACALCGRRMESTWSHGNPAYRCRHGRTSASTPDTAAANAFIRERDILARLPLLHTLMASTPHTPAAGRAKPITAGAAAKSCTNTATITLSAAVHPEEVINELRRRGLVLSYDLRTRTLEANSTPRARVTV